MKKVFFLIVFCILNTSAFAIFDFIEVQNLTDYNLNKIYIKDNSGTEGWTCLSSSPLYYKDYVTYYFSGSLLNVNRFKMVVITNFNEYYLIKNINRYQGLLVVRNEILESVSNTYISMD